MKVESAEVVKRDEKKQRKFLVVLLAALIAVIFALTVSIVVVILTHSNNGGREDGPEATEIEDLTYDEYREEIENKIASLEKIDIPAIEEIYNPYLTGVKDEKIRAMLSQDYWFRIMYNDYQNKYKKEVTNGMMQADDILQTIVSGINVTTAAFYYNDNDTLNEYNAILRERGYDNGGQ